MRTLLAGNWKMNGLRASLAEIRALNRGLAETPPRGDILICPPATLIAEAAKAVEGGPIGIGGQDCHALASGAFTGDISAEMLRDAGATAVISGHSERRLYHAEADSLIAAKVKAAHRAGLTAILCVGESETQRKQGRAGEVVAAQLEACVPAEIAASDLVVAYEPIWAIGTGKTPRIAEIEQMHGVVRTLLTTRFGAEG